MKCPVCLINMSSEMGKIGLIEKFGMIRMHCQNVDCPAIKEIKYKTHLDALVDDPNPWQCFAYNIPIKYNDQWFSLEGRNIIFGSGFNYQEISFTQIRKWKTSGQYYEILFHNKFMPLPTDNNFHLEAEYLFNRIYHISNFQ